MKKITVYLLALILALSGLTACSRRNTVTTPSPSPTVTVKPENSILPDTDEGIVGNNGGTTGDDDILTDDVKPTQSPTTETGSAGTKK